MNLVLLGPPGVGKGVQAERLSSLLQIPHVSSGDLFRTIVTADTPLARELRTFMDRGEYIPDRLVVDVMLTRLRQPDARRGFILDGFPRTVSQAEALDRWLAAADRQVDIVLDIVAPADVLMGRIAGRLAVEHRTDDLPAVIRTRLDRYQQQTQPVIDYYRKQGKLVEIDGARPIPEVNAEVVAALESSPGR